MLNAFILWFTSPPPQEHGIIEGYAAELDNKFTKAVDSARKTAVTRAEKIEKEVAVEHEHIVRTINVMSAPGLLLPLSTVLP